MRCIVAIAILLACTTALAENIIVSECLERFSSTFHQQVQSLYALQASDGRQMPVTRHDRLLLFSACKALVDIKHRALNRDEVKRIHLRK